jgi:DinB superfamily
MFKEVESFTRLIESSRERTLGLLETVAKLRDPAAALAYRPGPGRAHIGWQLTHIGITEELFATERLVPDKSPAWPDLVPRFKGGSTPDDNLPSIDTIRDVLNVSRQHLLATLAEYGDDRITEIPAAFASRGWTIRTILHVIAWHEPHHQGQAHLTLNLFKAAHEQ